MADEPVRFELKCECPCCGGRTNSFINHVCWDCFEAGKVPRTIPLGPIQVPEIEFKRSNA